MKTEEARNNPLIPLYVLSLAALTLLLMRATESTVWHRQSANWKLLQTLCWQASECASGPAHSFLRLSQTDELPGTESSPSACHALWSSRLLAADSVQEAEGQLKRARSCKRPALVHAWAGTLEWQAGREVQAKREWQRLTFSQLHGWARKLIIDDHTAQAKIVLQAALEKKSGHTHSGLHRLIGDIYQKESNWADAIENYETAWQLSQSDSRLPLDLAVAYRHAARYTDGISLLNQTINNVPSSRPWLVTTYFEELERLYRLSGDMTQAEHAAQQAALWKQKYE